MDKSPRSEPVAPPAPSAAPRPPRNVTAAGSLGAPKGRTESFTLVLTDRTQTFGSRLEAEAARIRAGGVGQVVNT